jgi:kynurenine 3-monooxygenase
MMAIEVARLGYRVVVIEKRHAADDGQSRRSINLALAPSTRRLLNKIAGVAGELKKVAVPLQGRVLHPVVGSPVFQPYAANPRQSSLLNPVSGAVSVARSELNAILRAAAARMANIEFHFGQRVVECDADRAQLKIQDANSSSRILNGEVIIGADGAGSTIRRLLRQHKWKIREDRPVLRHAYKELTFACHGNVCKSALHIWPRPGFLMMALPNYDGSFRGAIFLRRGGRNGFSALKSVALARRFFERHFPDVDVNTMEVVQQCLSAPVSSLTSLRCNPWHAGRVVMIGDACHTLYPFSGQGANLALEDCIHLRQRMAEFAPDWTAAFSEFTAARKPKADYLCEATRMLSPLILNALPQEGIVGHV